MWQHIFGGGGPRPTSVVLCVCLREKCGGSVARGLLQRGQRWPNGGAINRICPTRVNFPASTNTSLDSLGDDLLSFLPSWVFSPWTLACCSVLPVPPASTRTWQQPRPTSCRERLAISTKSGSTPWGRVRYLGDTLLQQAGLPHSHLFFICCALVRNAPAFFLLLLSHGSLLRSTTR